MGRKPSVKVTQQGQASTTAATVVLDQDLAAEAQELAQDKKKYKMVGPDHFTQFLMDLLKLECAPEYKRDYTDPSWPRDEKGRNIVVNRAYFIALRGPRKEYLGFRSLGDDEINGDVKIIIDFVDETVTDEVIQAKKWTAEQSYFRYFWMKKGEEFEDEEAMNMFLERFAKLETKPQFTFGPVTHGESLITNQPAQWIR